MKTVQYVIGKLGVWICNNFYPRPLTHNEIVNAKQYADLMVDTLKGDVVWYGRDRKQDHIPIVAERSSWVTRNDKHN